MIDVYLEQGKTWTFACAVDWPGWARRAKNVPGVGGDQAALEELAAYAHRYAAVVAPERFEPGELHVVARLPGTVTTDFGAPDARLPEDDAPWDEAAAHRLADLLRACWTAFDQAVDASAAELVKGPRGGGRDRDKVVDHTREAERSYGRALGVKVPPRTPWPEQRDALETAVRVGAPDARWPLRYAVRRFAWHVLDHAWEIQDKQP